MIAVYHEGIHYQCMFLQGPLYTTPMYMDEGRPVVEGYGGMQSFGAHYFVLPGAVSQNWDC